MNTQTETEVRRVLIVDDDDDWRQIAAREMHAVRPDLEVVEAASAAEALFILRALTPPDLVLSDLYLSGTGTGADVVRAAQDYALPVVMVSGHAPCVEHGVRFVAKDAFASCVAALLSGAYTVDRTTDVRRARQISVVLVIGVVSLVGACVGCW